MSDESVTVSLGSRSYDITIGEGLIDRAGALLRPLLERPRVVVVTDANVAVAQGPRLAAALGGAGIEAPTITLAAGEATKSFAELEALIGKLLALGVERGDLVVAFGGGVVGDLAGFAAAILKRGCRYAQIPTTLLAQVDSAVGGKTAINTASGKNLVGAFHQPVAVIADVSALATLPQRELAAGYAEIVKYAALGDPAFFEWLDANSERLLAGDASARIFAVKRACEMKAAIVAVDEQETGARALLNLGHTFGHALEAEYGYSDRLLHGEAVAAGMGLAFDFSVREGFCATAEAGRLKAHLRAAGLPAGLSDLRDAATFDAARLLARMRDDKKTRAGALTLILARRIGDAFVAPGVSDAAVAAFLQDEFRAMSHRGLQ